MAAPGAWTTTPPLMGQLFLTISCSFWKISPTKDIHVLSWLIFPHGKKSIDYPITFTIKHRKCKSILNFY